MQPITVQEAQNLLAEIIDKLPPGGEIVITRDDKPVAILPEGRWSNWARWSARSTRTNRWIASSADSA